MKQVRPILFAEQTSQPKHGLVMICDLEGFSNFFNQPDVSQYVSKFLNHVFEALNIIFKGGTQYCLRKPPRDFRALEIQPSHTKFLGDGALFVWTPTAKDSTFSHSFLRVLCNRLWNLKTNFDSVLEKCGDDVPVVDLPKRIRFGLARGTVFQLKYRNSSQTEYIGFCINLASRPQSYCPQLGFIASARLGLPNSLLEENKYVRVIAKKIKGFSNEIVIVDKSEFEELDKAVKDNLFAPLQ